MHKNISTIDYGKLALANSQNERNRLEQLKYRDSKEKRILLEIASDPSKAFDYGYYISFSKKGKEAKKYGFKKFTFSFILPHKSIFVNAGTGRLENVSLDGITTEININAPFYNKKKIELDIEKNGKMEAVNVGEIFMEKDSTEIFVHKKDLNRATVFGIKGFKSTLVWEDDYQYTITDNYSSLDKTKGNGILYSFKVRYYGDKDEVTFEQLEGRRYFLKRLIEKVISTSKLTDIKY